MAQDPCASGRVSGILPLDRGHGRTAAWPRLSGSPYIGSGGDPLAARLDIPPGPPRAYALFAHCFTCSKDLFAVQRIASELALRGIAVLRFDFTGLGASEGEFANTNFSSNVDDLCRAASYLSNHHRPAEILIGPGPVLPHPRAHSTHSPSQLIGGM